MVLRDHLYLLNRKSLAAEDRWLEVYRKLLLATVLKPEVLGKRGIQCSLDPNIILGRV